MRRTPSCFDFARLTSTPWNRKSRHHRAEPQSPKNFQTMTALRPLQRNRAFAWYAPTVRMRRPPPHCRRRSAPWSCHSCRSGPNCGSATFLRTRSAAWTANNTAAYCARHRCGADEAVLVRVSARTDSCFLRKSRPMSIMNRPGRSIHFIDKSIAPETPGSVAALNLSSTDTSLLGRARRNASPAVAPVFIATACGGSRPLIQSFLQPVFGRSASCRYSKQSREGRHESLSR